MRIGRRAALQGRAGLFAALLGATLLGACAPSTPRTTFPPFGSTPGAVGAATAAARQLVVSALAAVGLPAAESPRTYRPEEGAMLAAAPRTVLQVALPQDPQRGFVLIYALPSEQAAFAAARDHAKHVTSNTGRVLFPTDARHILRVVGDTVVSFWWSPEAALDARTTEIENVLRQIGSEVPVPGT